ncbi:GerW family sporulation protein [Carboxydochorda subterranea]|uniref:GerW family sporulation protein n=1 Tax=Carboxydichorda subterranea TaxID=3109565 RepID=A0ABZ1C0E5_9FIRM|nr:GerW family sporulation protein [Limnochorda sp. L945t]WRP18566.1 GerW family sporulation protein [Limnochorda sp. L945t]
MESPEGGQPSVSESNRGRHPIDELMHTAMDSLKSMVDVNTILGVPVEAPDGTVIIPVSRVSFGFVAGGSEFEIADGSRTGFPFGGGSGAGVSLSPVAFLVVGKGQVRLLPVSERAIYDRLLDLAPRLFDQIQRWTGQPAAVDGQSALREEPEQAVRGASEAASAIGRHGASAGRQEDHQDQGQGRRLSIEFE